MAPVQDPSDTTSSPLGASKRFECQVIGLPRPSVRWYKDGVNITTHSRYKFEYTPEGCVVLILENVTLRDQGVYSCRAENSEGCAETSAQLLIKGKMSASEEDASSIHTMSSFKKVEETDKSTSQSQRRPLLIVGPTSDDKEQLHSNAEEIEEDKTEKSNANSQDTGSISNSDAILNDEISNTIEDLLEVSEFGNKGRRLTTDSGIHSRGSSFSSEPDINITDESIQEMKEYLHGKIDVIYQPLEQDKIKAIKDSDIDLVVAQCEKLAATKEKISSANRLMTMANLDKQKTNIDSVNEFEARLLAGMYLFDSGLLENAIESKHGLPALELLVRKEALGDPCNEAKNQSDIMENQKGWCSFESEVSLKEVKYHASETIQEYEHIAMLEVNKLNALNIERSHVVEIKQENTDLVKATSTRFVEEDDETLNTKTTLSPHEMLEAQNASNGTPKADAMVDQIEQDTNRPNDEIRSQMSDQKSTFDEPECLKNTTAENVEAAEKKHYIDRNRNADEFDEMPTSVKEKAKQDDSNSNIDNDDKLDVHNRLKSDFKKTGEILEAKTKTFAIEAETIQNDNEILPNGDTNNIKFDTDVDNEKKFEMDFSASIESDDPKTTGKPSLIDNHEENPPIEIDKSSGSLDHNNDDDMGDRVQAGKYLFSKANPDNNSVKRRSEHEYHIRREAEDGELSQSQLNSDESGNRQILENFEGLKIDEEIKKNIQDNESVFETSKSNRSTELDIETDDDMQRKDLDDEFLRRIREMQEDDVVSVDNVGSDSHAQVNKNDAKGALMSTENISNARNENDDGEQGLSGEVNKPDNEQTQLHPNFSPENERNATTDRDGDVFKTDKHETKTFTDESERNQLDSCVLFEKDICDNIALKEKNQCIFENNRLSETEEVDFCTAEIYEERNGYLADPLQDKCLGHVDDTRPELPNIVNIIESLKGNKYIKTDESLTNEIENKEQFLKEIPDDSSLISKSKTTKEVQSLHENVKTVDEYDFVQTNVDGNSEASEDDYKKQIEKSDARATLETSSEKIVEEKEELKEVTTQESVGNLEIFNNKNITDTQDEDKSLLENRISEKQDIFPAINEENIKAETSINEFSRTKPERDIFMIHDIGDNVATGQKQTKVEEKEETQYAQIYDESSLKIHDKTSKEESIDKKESKNWENVKEKATEGAEGNKLEVRTLLDIDSVDVSEGHIIKLQWKIKGADLAEIQICKGTHKLGNDGHHFIDLNGDVLTLTIDHANLRDNGVFVIRVQNSDKEHGPVAVQVSALTQVQNRLPEEPHFIVEPVVDVKDDRRLSIKCSVSGFPSPQVVWYHHGQQLDPNALWDIYCQDGYHYLGVGDPSVLDCEDIVCRVENDVGFVQRVIRLKKEGDEVYCEPVLPPASLHAERPDVPPSLEIEISEIVTANLRKVKLPESYTDKLNLVSVEAGDILEVLDCNVGGNILARNVPLNDKVCYIPKDILAAGNDVSTEVCENVRIENNNLEREQHIQDSSYTEEAAMPERRKMKSPSPKMTSTPKMKRKEMDTDPDSNKELQKRLGFSENLGPKKEFLTPDSVEFTEYNDGTTRPMFKRRLKSVTAKSGETAQLECVVSGTPLPKILWLKNNRPLKASDGCQVIVDEGSNTLVFPSAREEDVGIYTARAMNVNGSIMCSAEFTLTDGRGLPAQPITDSPMDMDFTTPAYFFQMSSCEVAEGRIARFDCRVVAYPRPEIVWMRDGKVVEAADRFKLLNFNNEIYSLLIQDVRIADTGRYTCWARNKFGEAMTEAYLNVIALTEQPEEGDVAPKFLTRFYDQQTTEGTATDFKCLIAGRPEPSVTWLLDDLEIKEVPGLRMRHKDGVVSLEIKSPKVDQSGQYTCQLSNPLGEATCSARLTVIEDKLHGRMLPKFLKKIDHINAKDGEEVKFTCVIVGEPRPEVTWMFEHKPISDSNRRFIIKQEGDAYTLIIKNARFDDSGKITCKAVNDEGEVYCSANLNVRESKYIRDTPEKAGMGQDETDSKYGYVPTFTKRLQDVEVKEGSKATFEVRVMGIPDPEISWMKDGRVIAPDRHYHMTFENGLGQLVIDNVSASDTGVYTCIISNNQGKSSSTAALKLEDTTKKDRYIPEKGIEERTSRKDRYTPEKYSVDDSTLAKRPYLDSDRFEAAGKKGYETPLSSKKLEETYIPRAKRQLEYESPKRSYEIPKASYETPKSSYESPKTSYDSPKSSYESPTRPYESYKPKYDKRFESPESYRPKMDTRYGSPKRSYESPIRQYESISTRYESPIRQYDNSFTSYESPIGKYELSSIKYETSMRQYDISPIRPYESPIRPYDTTVKPYESPVRPYDSGYKTYESPVSKYDSSSARYESPVRPYDLTSTTRPTYQSPRRRSSSLGREEKVKALPKMPFDRPAILNKHEDSVRLSWLPAQTYDLPDDARNIVYIVEARELPGREWSKVSMNVPGTSATVRHLKPDKEYEFRVRAENRHGMSEPTWNATLEKRVDESSKRMDLPEMRAPPRLPTHRPIITDLGEETIRLAWRPAESYEAKRTPPVSYRLEAKELPGKDWIPLSSRLRDTTHYLSELPTDRDYMIRVRAENDYGISEPTESLWLPRARAFPGVPVTRPEIIDYEDTRAKLSWTRVDIPSFGLNETPLLYMLEVEEPPHKDWRTIARDLDDTEYIVEGLRPGHDYRFRVRAKTATGLVSEPSPAVSLYTKLAQTRAPVDRLEVLSYEPETRSVQLSWDRVNIPPYNSDDEPLMYMIEYQEPPMPEWRTLITGVPTTRYRVMNLDTDRDYQFRVRALTSYGVSPPSPALPVTFRQTPMTRGLPESVIISEVDSDSLRLTWRRPMYDLDKPINYQIEMLESPFSDWKPIATRVMDTTYKVTGLKPTRDYQFRVIPQADTGFLEPSRSAALTTLPVRPRLPFTEPKITELGPDSVQLSWRSAELPAYQRRHTPVHYKIEMAEMPSSNWVPVTRNVTDTSYNVTGLRPDQEYKFRIFAESDSGLSEPSMPAILHRRPVPRFSFNEPTIRDISQNVVHLAWTPADIDAAHSQDLSYMVEMQTPPGMANWSTLYARHPTPSVRLADLRPDLDYLVRVRAQCGSYTSEPTLPVYIPRRAAPPRLPVEEPYAVDIGADSVKLQWRSADLPTHIQDYAPVTYRLEAQESGDSTWVMVARGIPHTDFRVTGLNPQKDYKFRVKAENDYGLSEPTHPMSIRKRSVAPVLPNVEPLIYDVGPGAARLTWRPATLPSYAPSQSSVTYTLFVQELPFKTWRPLVKRIPHTSYYVSGLQPDKEYMFRVQAENEYGSSKPTEAVLLPRYTDYRRPISVPEVSDFDEDLTSVKLQWRPTALAGPDFDRTPRRYTVETWEPIRHEWKPVASGVPDTSYQIRGLPKLPDHLFRVRMESDQPTLSEPSLPVSLSRYNLPRIPIHRPQLYELEDDTVRLSWQPVHVPQGVSRRSVRYSIEQREIPEPHWWPVVTDLTETSYKIRGLRPKSDYEFRVKAVYEGTSTEPSYPVSLYRRPVIPTVKFDTPVVYDMDDTSLSLRWNTVDVPAFTHDEEPLLFIIERQTLPDYEWQPVATNVTDKSYTVRDLKPYQDYNFRVRGVYSTGYTEPSPYVPVYRRPIRYSVPVARPEVWEEDPSSARLTWHRAYIPRYYSSTPLRYRVEMQEDSEMDWRSVLTGITTPDVTVRDISPRKNYRFRIRAEMENGDLSEPTPPIQYYKQPAPFVRDALAEFKPVEYKAIFLKHPYYEVLTKYVPPSMPIHKPDMIVINPETVELSWRPAILAEAIKGNCNLTYNIEVRCPPSFEWRELVTGLKTCSYTVQNLHPRVDYVFRVRAWNEYGSSEAGLPVSLYRPAVWKTDDDEYDEEFEKEWERKYGTQEQTELLQKVPPKLPIDTPKTVTQTNETIWFTWLPARIPAYAKQANITYVVEIKEPPSSAWQRDAEGLIECFYVKEGLDPNKEYHIRVRAETEFGPSDPTMPIMIRGKGTGSRPGSRRSSMERDDISDKIDLSYLENVMAGVPPRMPSTRPMSSKVGPDRLTLSWSSCRTPSYVRASDLTYIIEKREPPGHVWTILAKDIKGHKYDITGLNPEQDYMFRVRAKNEYGLSEPTLPMTLYRDRDDYVPQKVRSRSSSRDSISMLVSKVMRRSSSVDYGSMRMEDDRSSEDRMPSPPLYVTTTYDTQYGVLGKKGKIHLQVRGYPLPTVHWYKGEEKIQYGDQFNAFITPAGDITLEIKIVGWDTFGEYKCYAENASGAAAKVVTFEIAEPPTVLETIKDVSALKGDSVTLTCKVDGLPSPTVKWVKDWRPLADCTRIRMMNDPPETFMLEITNLLESDEGLYACTVENIAGKVTVSGRLKVEIDVIPGFLEVTLRTTPIEERYHVLEEIGRGRYGVVRRVVEISTGKSFAANFMTMRNKAQKSFFMSEFEALRSVSQVDGVLRLYDAFETERSLIFVTEILSEPELLEKVITDGNWTEVKVSALIKKLLSILHELQHLKILHLDIKPSNIRMSGADLDSIKLLGFGLSRLLLDDEDITHNYGSVGYASPEQVTNQVLTPTSDTWAVGVLTYILLSGYGPFQGSSAVEILNMMSECKWSFEGRGFDKFSKEGLDFISKLLIKDPSKRLTVEQCLNHPWMSTQSNVKINTEQLRQYCNAEKLQRETEKVYTTVQLQSFAKIRHGAKALYQPAVDIESGEIIFPDADEYGDYLDEDAWYEWQLQYLDDPDSQIYPIQDKKFTVRECRHAGAPKYTLTAKERSDKDEFDHGTGIMFRDKIQPTTFLVGENVTFYATVVCETKEVPVVTWYRDEQLLSDDYRADASFKEDTGEAKLTIVNTKDYDAAVYKCVARIKDGRVSCEARLFLGDIPSKPGRPLVIQTSGSEAFLTWSTPVSDGNAYLLGYRIDYRKAGDAKWTQGPYVTEEYALLTELEPSSSYIFRVSGHNRYGHSPFSWSSIETKTLAAGAPKVSIATTLQPLMQFSSFDKQQLVLPAESRRPSLSVEEEAKINDSDPAEVYSFQDTISKGAYGEYKLCTNKTTSQQRVVKIVPYKKDNHESITTEFELLRSLRQSNLITVLDSYISGENFYVIYEKLSGVNIVQYLCLHKTYKEETVARMVRQILDALQYLEHYGIVHLNLQPSSVVMATRRRAFVKLRDFTLAHKIDPDLGSKVPLAGYPDYTAPEVIKGEKVTFTADLWTLGALTFTMLSGISPFGGKSLEETMSRVLFDRYSVKEMYDNVSKESVKFVCKLLCRLPRNRPTVNKCLNSQWLNLSESMVNARNSKMFTSEKLQAFLVDYLAKRANLDYSLAMVDIDSLPKITTGPLIRPILNDKITKRMENLMKTKKKTAPLEESQEAKTPKQSEENLLETITSKIKRDTAENAAIIETINKKELVEIEQISSEVEMETVENKGRETNVKQMCDIVTVEKVKDQETVITEDKEAIDKNETFSKDKYEQSSRDDKSIMEQVVEEKPLLSDQLLAANNLATEKNADQDIKEASLKMAETVKEIEKESISHLKNENITSRAIDETVAGDLKLETNDLIKQIDETQEKKEIVEDIHSENIVCQVEKANENTKKSDQECEIAVEQASVSTVGEKKADMTLQVNESNEIGKNVTDVISSEAQGVPPDEPVKEPSKSKEIPEDLMEKEGQLKEKEMDQMKEEVNQVSKMTEQDQEKCAGGISKEQRDNANKEEILDSDRSLDEPDTSNVAEKLSKEIKDRESIEKTTKDTQVKQSETTDSIDELTKTVSAEKHESAEQISEQMKNSSEAENGVKKTKEHSNSQIEQLAKHIADEVEAAAMKEMVGILKFAESKEEEIIVRTHKEPSPSPGDEDLSSFKKSKREEAVQPSLDGDKILPVKSINDENLSRKELEENIEMDQTNSEVTTEAPAPSTKQDSSQLSNEAENNKNMIETNEKVQSKSSELKDAIEVHEVKTSEIAEGLELSSFETVSKVVKTESVSDTVLRESSSVITETEVQEKHVITCSETVAESAEVVENNKVIEEFKTKILQTTESTGSLEQAENTTAEVKAKTEQEIKEQLTVSEKLKEGSVNIEGLENPTISIDREESLTAHEAHEGKSAVCVESTSLGECKEHSNEKIADEIEVKQVQGMTTTAQVSSCVEESSESSEISITRKTETESNKTVMIEENTVKALETSEAVRKDDILQKSTSQSEIVELNVKSEALKKKISSVTMSDCAETSYENTKGEQTIIERTLSEDKTMKTVAVSEVSATETVGKAKSLEISAAEVEILLVENVSSTMSTTANAESLVTSSTEIQSEQKLRERTSGEEAALKALATSSTEIHEQSEDLKAHIATDETKMENASGAKESIEMTEAELREKTSSEATLKATAEVSATEMHDQSETSKISVATDETKIESASDAKQSIELSDAESERTSAEEASLKASFTSEVSVTEAHDRLESSQISNSTDTTKTESASGAKESIELSAADSFTNVKTLETNKKEFIGKLECSEIISAEAIDKMQNMTSISSVKEEVDGSILEYRVSVVKSQETLTSSDVSSSKFEEITTSESVTEENLQQSSHAVAKTTDITNIESNGKLETLISGSMELSTVLQGLEMSVSSFEEKTLTESAATCEQLETAKAIKSTEIIREFVTNDDDIEEMKKELLEDAIVPSAECGKYLMGLHEEFPSVQSKLEAKPDEEEIAKETANRYIDDALMFC